MNREIKFRRWYIELKEMTYSKIDEPLSTFFGIIETYPSYYLVMQYTGLKDKNGNEIYESDILKMCSNDLFLPKQINVIVVDNMGAFGVYPLDGVTDSFNNIYSGKMLCFYPEFKPDLVEIIGNIHENPELLK